MIMHIWKNINKQEHGHVLILLVLIIFAFSSFAMVPLMNFVRTGIVTAKNTGLHTQEIYAAEAGVRDGIWKIQRVYPGLPVKDGEPPLEYTTSDNINGSSVDTDISWISWETYRIHSLATNLKTGHKITIDSDLCIDPTGGLDLTAFTKDAMTSPGEIRTFPGDKIYGDVRVEHTENITGPGVVYGDITEGPITGWPTEDLLEMYFLRQVDTSSPYSSSTIDVSIPAQRGHLYAAGYSNGNYVITGSAELTGVIFVEGNLTFDQNADIYLNGYTIFVTGNIGFGPQAALNGPGAIIAMGSITFSPNVTPSYIFVMSVHSWVDFLPSGEFVGAVCGHEYIKIKPTGIITWQDPGIGNLNMPGLYNTINTISTWKIH
jgi:hypothetical protein